ncbi:hypothetical protein ACFX2A_046627 [Malus domestica]
MKKTWCAVLAIPPLDLQLRLLRAVRDTAASSPSAITPLHPSATTPPLFCCVFWLFSYCAFGISRMKLILGCKGKGKLLNYNALENTELDLPFSLSSAVSKREC